MRQADNNHLFILTELIVVAMSKLLALTVYNSVQLEIETMHDVHKKSSIYFSIMPKGQAKA